MTDETKLPPCDRFTVLNTRKGGRPECDVCDQLEEAHQNPGRRMMSGAEIEELRRRIIVERFELLQAQAPRSEGGNGAT